MPQIPFYIDNEHNETYRKLDDATKKEIMGKARKLLYKELDKAK